jgi:hypothetical protein
MNTSPQPVANKQTRYLLSDVTGVVTRLLLWLIVSAFYPLSVTATALSFRVEVLECSLPGALPPGAQLHVTLAERVLRRLEAAEKKEPDPWLRDDIRIAWITVLEASRGNRQPHIDATYRVLGLHPDKVWPAIIERHLAILGEKFALLDPSPLPNSLDIPQTNRKPMAVSRDGDAPQKTCAYGAAINSKPAGTVDPNGLESTASRVDGTGSSCRTVTKREARRTHTSEFGHDAPLAGVAAPADNFPSHRKKAV